MGPYLGDLEAVCNARGTPQNGAAEDRQPRSVFSWEADTVPNPLA